MKIARDDGITRGIYNVNQATMLRKASFTGFDGNMTGADLWGAAGRVQNDFVNAITTGLEYGSYMIGGAGLLRAGVQLAGKGLLATAQAGFRGSFIHGSSKLGAVWGGAKGLTTAGLGYGTAQAGWSMLTDPAGTAETVRSTIALGQDIYRQIDRTGGFTYAAGLTAEVDFGTKINVAGGGFLAVNFRNMDVNYGMYFTGETGAKLGMPIPAVNLGLEQTVFTSPDYKNALVGKYSLTGAGDNYRKTGRAMEASYISAAKGEISGYQFTTELWSGAYKVDTYRDPNAYHHRGYGIIYDAKAGDWITGYE